MAKETTAARSHFFQELLQFGVYKRQLGRVTRQATFAALALSVVFGAWRMSEWTRADLTPAWRFGIAGGLLLVGLWLSFRIVNLPRFADFLIAVENEMSKVNWPSRGEMFRSSMVVMATMIFLALLLWGYDVVWSSIFVFLKIRAG